MALCAASENGAETVEGTAAEVASKVTITTIPAAKTGTLSSSLAATGPVQSEKGSDPGRPNERFTHTKAETGACRFPDLTGFVLDQDLGTESMQSQQQHTHNQEEQGEGFSCYEATAVIELEQQGQKHPPGSPPKPSRRAPRPLPLQEPRPHIAVLYEDEHMAVVVKPPGIPTQGHGE